MDWDTRFFTKYLMQGILKFLKKGKGYILFVSEKTWKWMVLFSQNLYKKATGEFPAAQLYK
jgi:hypothetical protein